MTLPGIDVSSFQGAPGRWMTLAGKIEWAGVKISELSAAGPYVDPDCAADWPALRAAGIGRLGYLFGHPAMSVSRTVALFCSVLDPLGLADDDAVAIDLEVSDGLSSAAVSGWARDVAAVLRQKTGRAPVLYTFRDFALAGNCAGLGHLPLWIADPDSPPGHPQVPAPWVSWAIHQYKQSPMDRDVANYPDLAAMRAALGKRKPEPAFVWKDHEPMMMKRGAGAITPVALPAGATKLVLTPESTAQVEVQTHDHGSVTVDLDWQPPGGKVVDIPGGVQFVHLHRIDGGLDDVSVTWQ
jgi:lysozyme